MKTHDVPTRGFAPVRWAEVWPERLHDNYKLRGKLAEPAACSDCGAVYHRGSWRWLDQPEGVNFVVCPACHRVRDKYPAGYVELTGDRLGLLRDELLAQIRHVEVQEGGEHPLERIMGIEETTPKRWMITTTGVHLARRLGEALHNAHQGRLDFHYNQDEKLVRVRWET